MTDKADTPPKIRYNSWDYVREVRERIETKKYPVLEGLEDSWQLIRGGHGRLIKRNEDERFASSPLRAFLCYVDMGFYPPPEVMLSICHCFQHYMDRGGEIELEDVFFNERKKGVGNYSARVGADRLYEYIWFLELTEYMPHLRTKNRPLKTITQLVDKAFLHLGIDENQHPMDNFLRSYRRWKKRYNLKINS